MEVLKEKKQHIQSAEMEEMLVNVRKAYRLLYSYQRRVMDLIKYIGNCMGLKFHEGWAWFSDDQSIGKKVNLDMWAWDWLNMYMYEFIFQEKNFNDKILKFSVALISDTGKYDSGADQLDVKNFANVELSETKLMFVCGQNCWHNDYQKDIDDLQYYKRGDKELVRNGSNERIYLLKTYPLKRFLNGDSTREVLNNFVEFCNANGVKGLTLVN